MALRPSTVARRLARLHEAHEQRIEALAAKARAEIVIPFCDRHGVWFVSGMGVWSFEKLLGKPIKPGEPGEPGDRITSLDWDQFMDEGFAATDSEFPEDREWVEQRRPPEGYAAVREVVELEVPGTQAWGGVTGTLGLYMEDYKPCSPTD